ncbi:MAG: PD40 domain-containing protein [Armatimonadetes bacterium]|nr:PD40 domain-containing protein [Armatimonadota bacterium]
MNAIALPFILMAPTLQGPPFLRYPDVHGDMVAFSCEGDVWIGDLKTGGARRLTSDPGLEDNPVFSPDGKTVAFHAEYDGFRGAYVMPVEGGAPKRVTPAMEFRAVTGWTPDGKSVVYRRIGIPESYVYESVPVAGGAPKRVPLEFASHVWFGPTQDDFTFTRFLRWSTAWFHYIGGMSNQIWVHRNGQFKQLTDLEGTNEYPVWCGSRIYFVNQEGAKFTLMSVEASGGRPKKEAGPYDVEMRELSTDGTKVVYEKGRDVEVFDPATGKTSAVTFDLQSDLVHTRPYTVAAQDYSVDATLTPGAKRALVETRGQIVSLPVGEGEARLWKAKPGARLQQARMSPDAKKVAYVSDESGEQQVWVSDADGTGAKKLSDGKRQVMSLVWSPDGKWIVTYDSRMRLGALNVATGEDKEIARFTGSWRGPVVSFSPDSKWVAFDRTVLHTSISQIELYELETGQSKVVGDGTSDDTGVAFSQDGKWLAFLSNRELGVNNDPILNQLNLGKTGIAYIVPLKADTKSPFAVMDPEESEPKKEDKKDEPFRIDWDGLYERRIELPVNGTYTRIAMVGNRVLFAGEGNVTYYDIAAKKGGTVTPGGGFELSKDGSKLLVGRGRTFRVVDSTGSDLPPTAGVLSFGGLRLQIEPLTEWKQIFWDAWRLSRDYFYVENMHGNDWDAIGAKYSAMLPSVRSRPELNELIRWMQAEIGSSHQYLGGGDGRNVKPRLAASYLGVDYAAEGTKIKVSHIVRGDGYRASERSPLADPSLGVKDGMFLLKVGGEPVSSVMDVSDALVGRAGQVVSLTFAKDATGVGAFTVYVKPVADEGRMRYVEWVANNRKYVEKASGGRVGYLHLAAMGDDDMSDFIKQYFSQRNKEALIVDDRFNNGGYIQTLVNNVLGAKVSGYFNMRNSREPWSRQSDAFIGPMCCLINEFAISCGEEFPHRFKDLGLGPLIGRRTMGGEVGSSPGWPLVDGGVINVPNYGMFTGKSWVIEGAGVSPDIDVPSDPGAWVKGTDPQLDVAVKSMLEALKKKPVQWPQQPPDRVRTKGAGG